MNARIWSALCLAAGLLSAPAAHALTLGTVTSQGNGVDTSFTSASQIGVDVQFVNRDAVTLEFTLDAADITSGSVPFNAILSQVAGGYIGQVAVGLIGGASFLNQGTATSLAGTFLPISFNGNQAELSFQPTTTEVYLGSPFGDLGTQDWAVSFGSMAEGQSFTLSISAVPEPASWQLAGAAVLVLSAASVVARKKRK